jgi:hypothetical protein
MNKKLISLSLSFSLLFPSMFGPVWASGFTGEGPVRTGIPSAIPIPELPLNVSALDIKSGIIDPMTEGSKDLADFSEGMGLIEEGVVPGDTRQPAEKMVASVASINKESFRPAASSVGTIDSHLQANSSKKFSLARRLALAVESKLKDIFDGGRLAPSVRGLGVAAFAPHIRPLPRLKLPKGVKADSSPIMPDTRHLPKASVKILNALVTSDAERFNTVFNARLMADSQNGADIEKALRGWIDRDDSYGVTNDELGTSNVRLVEVPGQLPTWYVSFHQQKASRNVDKTTAMIPIFGASLTFVIQVKDGKAIVKGVHGRLFPNIVVDSEQKFSDEAMQTRIRSRLKMNGNLAPQISFQGRQIFYVPAGSKGNPAGWHAASLYKVQGVDALLAADIATGQTFLWDMRLGVAAPLVSTGKAQFEARVPISDHDMTNPPNLSQIPLPGATVRLSDGREIVADNEGRVSVNLPDGKTMRGTARLDSPNEVINNQSGNPLEVNVSLVKDRDSVIVVFNPPYYYSAIKPAYGMRNKIIKTLKRWWSPLFRVLDDQANEARQAQEKELAQVAAFVSHHTFVTWAQAHGVGLKDGLLNQKLTINVNIADECNAYYDPSSNTLNFFLSSAQCINTGTLPGVSFHESGHWTHALVAGYVSMGLNAMASVDPGLGEGIGDMFATHILQTPLIGEHFFNDPSQSPLPNGALRTTQGSDQFDPSGEVHEQGKSFMETIGYLGSAHTRMIKALTENLKDASLAKDQALKLLQSLIFPHIYGYALAQDIPAALGVIYLAAQSLTDATLRKIAMDAIEEGAAEHGMNKTSQPPSV